MITNDDTIAAVASGVGGAVALIRVSGDRAVEIGDSVFRSVRDKKLADAAGFTLHYGHVADGETLLDDVLLSLFRAPHSYTGEDMIEISCHASPYVVQRLLELLLSAGARAATRGEFTLRAFLAGKMDLSQAEAVADMIAADNRAAHSLAFRQMKGGYSDEFNRLRQRLVELVSMLELELDFGEEDVEFADRKQLSELLSGVEEKIQRLISSFQLGNILKDGVPVTIVGAPNVGKSTLLNAFLSEEKALVSDIAGTTRDVIEDTLNIDGMLFRFIDTAGIRDTDDPLESLGIERTYDRMSRASVVLLMADARESTDEIAALYAGLPLREEQRVAVVLNKCDCLSPDELSAKQTGLSGRIPHPVFLISAKRQTNLGQLLDYLRDCADPQAAERNSTIVFNARHYEALQSALDALGRARTGMAQRLPADLLAQDIREVLYHIGTVTGQITTDEILGSIFSRFCIGK